MDPSQRAALDAVLRERGLYDRARAVLAASASASASAVSRIVGVARGRA
jgi:hypothetical protein